MTDLLHATTIGDEGPWVVFCHGLFGQGRNWTQVAKSLVPGHRALLVDLPDHGRSPWTERFDFVEHADRVVETVHAHTREPVALVGHSLGGKIAMVMALRHSDQVERLCVVDVSPVDYARDGTSEFAGYIDAMSALDLDAVRRRADADAALQPDVPNTTVRSFLLQNLRRSDDGWSWQPNLQLLRRDLPILGGWPADDLAGLAPYDGPVLWLSGARSDYVRDEYAEAMAALFPKVRRVTVKDAGHWVHSEQQETFVAVLARFLGAARPGS